MQGSSCSCRVRAWDTKFLHTVTALSILSLDIDINRHRKTGWEVISVVLRFELPPWTRRKSPEFGETVCDSPVLKYTDVLQNLVHMEPTLHMLHFALEVSGAENLACGLHVAHLCSACDLLFQTSNQA